MGFRVKKRKEKRKLENLYYKKRNVEEKGYSLCEAGR